MKIEKIISTNSKVEFRIKFKSLKVKKKGKIKKC